MSVTDDQGMLSPSRERFLEGDVEDFRYDEPPVPKRRGIRRLLPSRRRRARRGSVGSMGSAGH